jgi:peptidoglycan hydrolase-like protein with peptidoglycan-binding domain
VRGAAAPAPRTIPTKRGALPIGKGMWIWQPERTEGNNADAIVARAKATGLTHLYVRTGTLKGGFDGAEFLDRLLPKAHAAGLRVYGWDFPYLNDIDGDVARAAAAATHVTPDGHRIDGFASDIELRSMGVNINNVTAFVYGQKLRAAVGPDFPLIATVPRPSAALVNYPFPEVAAFFDAIAPMVYWMGNDPAATVADTIAKLAPLNRPIIPVGQAYDGGSEGGPPGVPARPQIIAFMQSAEKAGAAGVSWWSWQHADQQAWDAVRDSAEFMPPVGPGTSMNAGQVRAYQVLLTSLGFKAALTGVWDVATASVVADYQRAARLPVTGMIDAATRDTMLTPFPPPLHPTPIP